VSRTSVLFIGCESLLNLTVDIKLVFHLLEIAMHSRDGGGAMGIEGTDINGAIGILEIISLADRNRNTNIWDRLRSSRN